MSTPDRLEAVEDAIRFHEDPVVTAPEIADIVLEETDLYDSVGEPRREALNDLSLLERTETVDSKQTGARARAFWHTERVISRPPERPAEHPDQSAFTEVVEIETNGGRDRDRGGDRDRDPDLEDVLSGWHPGRSREGRQRRLEAGLEVLEWARGQTDPVSRSDVVDATYADLAIEGQSKDTYWRKIARESLQKAIDGGLVTYHEGLKKYEWTG